MKHITSITTLTLIAASGLAQAAAPSSSFSQTANVAIASDYMFRGVSQTDSSLAIQGGFDISHTSGFSAGVWASNISFTDGGSELDLYAAYTVSLSKDISASLGYIHYVYQTASIYNTGEVNLSLSGYGLTAKASYAVTDYFGFTDSDGTGYYELNYSYTFEQLGKLALSLHYGWTDGSGDQDSYQDYSVGLALPVDSYSFGVTWSSCNNAGKTFYGDSIAGSTATFFVKKTF